MLSADLSSADLSSVLMTDRGKRAATASATTKSLESATADAVVEREPSSSPRKTVGQMRMESLTFKTLIAEIVEEYLKLHGTKESEAEAEAEAEAEGGADEEGEEGGDGEED